MANVVVPVTYVNTPNLPVTVPYATGESTTPGTIEDFECAFPSYNGSCYILVQNGATATVQVELLSNGTPGYTPKRTTVPKKSLCAIPIDPTYTKNADNTVILRAVPLSVLTLQDHEVKVFAIYASVTPPISSSLQLIDYLALNNDLATVADAIRAKSGTTSGLSFPSGFVYEINKL